MVNRCSGNSSFRLSFPLLDTSVRVVVKHAGVKFIHKRDRRQQRQHIELNRQDWSVERRAKEHVRDVQEIVKTSSQTRKQAQRKKKKTFLLLSLRAEKTWGVSLSLCARSYLFVTFWKLEFINILRAACLSCMCSKFRLPCSMHVTRFVRRWWHWRRRRWRRRTIKKTREKFTETRKLKWDFSFACR